ncbi:GNAT family N-acetyltransferase [Arthrobacter sp. NPDC055138]
MDRPAATDETPLDVRLTDAAALEFDQVLALYDAVGWTAYTSSPETVSAALSGSTAIAVAHAGTELVGLARVISDGASICYLQDVLVRPAFQRRGIGRRLVRLVLRPFSHVRQKVLLTDDEAGQKAFYESLGYTQVTDNDGGALRAFARFDD